MKILIDTENKTITVMEDVNMGELFKYLQSHFTDTKPFSNGWKDYKLILTPDSGVLTWGDYTIPIPGEVPTWDPYQTPTTNPFNTPGTFTTTPF